MLSKNELIKKWKDLCIDEKQLISILAGVSAGLFLKGIIKSMSKSEDVIHIIVEDGSEVTIFLGDE